MDRGVGRLSLRQLAWRQLQHDAASSIGVAVALLLALLPAGLLFVESSGTRSDLRTVAAASDGIVVQRTGVADLAAFDAFQQQVQSKVGPSLGEYVDAGSAAATAGPYRIDSIASGRPGPPIDAADVGVGYMSNLAARVSVEEGVLPTQKPAAGESEPTASMAQTAADRAGVRLFDTVCIRLPSVPAGSSTAWCARITALWAPDSATDALLGSAGGLRLFTERDPYFALLAQAAPSTTAATRQYRAQGATVAGVDPAVVQQGVRDAMAALQAAQVGTVQGSLDADLARYAATKDAVRFPVRLLTVALIPLLLMLVAAVARWYLSLRLHDLALLRARGWSRRRLERLVLRQFAILGGSALVVGLACLAALAWQADGGARGLLPVSPSPGQLVAVAIAIGVPLVAAVMFTNLARWAARQRVLRLQHPEGRLTPAFAWRGTELNGLLVVPAALLLLLPRLPGSDHWLPLGSLADLGILLVSVAGLVMLVVAALPAMSLVAELTTQGRGDVEGTLARWQLRRWWQRHAAAGFLVVLAFAIASFSAVGVAVQVLSRATLGRDVTVSLGIGLVSALVAGMLAYGLVFQLACRSRRDDHTALLVDGLPAAGLRRSLAIEQQTVLIESLAVGLVLGLILAWTDLPLTPAAAAAGMLTTAVLGLVAGLTAASFVRKRAIGFGLIAQGRRAT